MKATLTSIAKTVGCSVATVSRALSGKAKYYRISKSTVKRIQEEAKRQEYIVDIGAQKQHKEKSAMIGLLLPSVSNPYFADMASVIISELYHLHYTAILMDTMENESDFEKSALELVSRNVEGIIAVPCGSSSFLLEQIDASIPVVLIDRYYENTSLPYVTANNYRGARDAVSQLTAYGHRSIACIQGVLSSMPNKERVRGFIEAVNEEGIADSVMVVGNDFSIQNGYLETKILLSGENRPSAIFTLSNTILLGAIKAIREAGLNIPQDISVISFDDNPYMEFMTPAICRIGQPVEDMAKLAVKILTGRINGPRISSQLQLAPKYMPGDSIRQSSQH